jgi:HAD superfamily hydrolase (TIGR01490 family)
MPEMKKAAIFDLDGTLIPNTSAEKTFFFYLLRSGGLSILNLLQMGAAIWSARGNFHDMVRMNKRYLRHKKVEKLESVARTYFEPRIKKLVFPKMLETIQKHREDGAKLLMLSGTLDVIAGCFARELELDGCKAGSLEIKNGKYTGRLKGILPYGMGKLEVLSKLHDEFGFDRNQTILYANVFSDRYVMNAVVDPVAVNPDKKLRKYANKHGWKILDVSK